MAKKDGLKRVSIPPGVGSAPPLVRSAGDFDTLEIALDEFTRIRGLPKDLALQLKQDVFEKLEKLLQEESTMFEC